MHCYFDQVHGRICNGRTATDAHAEPAIRPFRTGIQSPKGTCRCDPDGPRGALSESKRPAATPAGLRAGGHAGGVPSDAVAPGPTAERGAWAVRSTRSELPNREMAARSDGPELTSVDTVTLHQGTDMLRADPGVRSHALHGSPVAAELGEQVQPLEAGQDACAGVAVGEVEFLPGRSLRRLAGSEEDVGGLDGVAGAFDDGRLVGVLELPHVTRPVIGREEVQCLVAHPADARTLEPQPPLADEVGHE